LFLDVEEQGAERGDGGGDYDDVVFDCEPDDEGDGEILG